MDTFAGIVSDGIQENDASALRAMLNPEAQCLGCQKAVFGVSPRPGGGTPVQAEIGGRKVLAFFSGTLENIPALRRVLEKHGAEGGADSPAELLIRLYEVFGSDLFSRLKGAFAAALYDTGKRRLLLGRDLIGAEPLYYFIHKDVLAFANSLAVLGKHPLTPRELDINAVSTFLSLQYIPEPDTIFRNVRKLPPGHLLESRLGEATTSIRAFAKLDFSVKSSDLSYRDAQHEVRRRVEEEVAAALADGDTGVFLSGGVDSTILAALAARHRGGKPVETFTVGFGDAAYDERALAAESVKFINGQTGGALNHHIRALEPLPLTLAQELAAFHDEPYADASVLPTHLLCKFASGTVTAALGGDGGDEFFSGYERYGAMRIAAHFELLPEVVRRGLCRAFAKLVPDAGERTFCGRCRRMLKLLGDSSHNAYFHLLDRCPDEVKKRLLGPKLRDALWHDQAEVFSRWEWELTAQHPAESFAELDIHTYLPGDGCAKLNIAAGAAGLEVRTPYLSSGVTELSSKLPLDYKMHGSNRKRILKSAFADILPPGLERRRKRGFGVPVASWLRGHWKEGVREVLFDSQLVSGGFVEKDELQTLWEAHQSGRADFSYLIWSLVNLAWFLDRH
jgi:asparagine synthase (glutamine-hydrolysing)